MRLVFNLIFILIFLVLNGFSQTSPPKPLNFVKDHWTPYNPPSEFPEGTEVYIIQKGDTLWDLASKKLGNPYLWPQIWENNKYILDAHWIYPGDPLVIVKGVEKPSEEITEEEGEEISLEELEEEVRYEEREGAKEPEYIAKPIPLGDDSDIYCFAKITGKDENFPFKILETDDSDLRYTLTQGQIVYINGGSAEGIKAGDSFLIARDEGLLEYGKDVYGRLWILTGKITVICANEHNSTARVDYACQSIYRGENLIPYEPTPIPAKVLKPLQYNCLPEVKNLNGKIIYSEDEVVSIFSGHNVVINLGTKEGLEPGDLLRVYRKMENGIDRIILGRLGVLTVHDNASTAKILESSKEIHIGDGVELE